jgi:hypothetical protein
LYTFEDPSWGWARNSSQFPSGDQSGESPASSAQGVTWDSLPPSTSTVKIASDWVVKSDRDLTP